MNYGGIYIFDSQWQYLRQVELPANADPIALLPFNGEVLVADWYGDRVHRIATSGNLIGDLQSPGLQQVLAESAIERRKFQIYGWAAVGNCAILVLILLVKGVSRRISSQPEEANAARESQVTDEIVWIEPDPGNVRRMRKAITISKWLIIPLVGVLAFLTWVTTDVRAVYDLSISVAGFIAIYLLAHWMMRVNTSTAIGLQRNHVTLRDHTGYQAKYPAGKIYFNDQFVGSDDIAVFMGQPQMPIYDRQRLMSEVVSRLPRSQQISHWQMQKKLVAMRHPNGLILVIASLLLGVTALLLLFRSLL